LVFLAYDFGGKVGGPGGSGKVVSSFWQEAIVNTPYSTVVEQAMLLTYHSLNERQRRLYAASEALKLGHGGVNYVSHLLGCHRKTVQRGLVDLFNGEPPLPADQARKKGVADVLACPSSPNWITLS
jgi:hypothetical protein